MKETSMMETTTTTRTRLRGRDIRAIFSSSSSPPSFFLSHCALLVVLLSFIYVVEASFSFSPSSSFASMSELSMSHVQKAIDELQEKRNEAIEYTTENRKSLDVIPEADDLDQLEREEEEESSSVSVLLGGQISELALANAKKNTKPKPPTFGSCSSTSDCQGDRMFCIDGKCRCPVFFPDGENCDVPREPEDGDWCLTPLKEWPKAGPKYKKNKKVLHDFSTCAIVGSAGTMRNSNLGGEIDAHTAVFRFNEAPHKGYEKDVGSKTTLRFQNRDRSGFAEKDGEICVVREGKWYKGQNSKGKCRLEQMPDKVEKYVDGHWKVHKTNAPKDVGRPWMSNGMAGITFAMHMCARVDVYGFTFGTGYYFKKYLGKAKDWGRPGGFIRPPSKGLANRHSWIKERECLLKLSEELPNSVIVHESAQKGGRGGGFAHSTKGRRLLLNDTATMH